MTEKTEKHTLTLELPRQFVNWCEDDNVTPEHVLTQFMRDVCYIDGSSGSDERRMAREYYTRCGYEGSGY